ncbi:MAG: hypothetical protein ACTSRT_14700 [Promethearchaeota archaeon]
MNDQITILISGCDTSVERSLPAIKPKASYQGSLAIVVKRVTRNI